MKKLEYLIDKFYEVSDKIGKHNLMLIAFIVIVLIITGLYSTFSFYTSTDGVEVVNGVTTYKFVLDPSLSVSSIIIPAKSEKYLDVVVTNNEEMALQYGLYYSATGEVQIGYTYLSEKKATDVIDASDVSIVSMRATNDTNLDITVTFGLAYGFENGGDLILPEGKNWILKYLSDGIASTYIQNLYNDGSAITTANIGGSTSNPQVHLNTTQGIMLDNNGEYRYYGADPDNYVWYNDELWRIISVGNVKSSATDTVGETRVKIVKADILKDDNNLSAYSYDSSASTINSGYGVNDWSQADLMTELNSLYLNSTSGTCYTGSNNTTTACNFTNTGLNEEARSLTADALYYLGGSSTYSGIYANDYYTFERGTEVWGGASDQTCSDGACPRATTWTGRVGIIYPSDYAYATDLSVCTKDVLNYDRDTNCKSKDWLLYSSNYQWTISPYSGYASSAFRVLSDGYVNVRNVYNAGAVRPVQYLRSEVTIVEGEGTTEKPYILGT